VLAQTNYPTLDFGHVDIGKTNRLDYSLGGGSPCIQFNNVAITGTNAGDFIKGVDSCTGSCRGPGSICTIPVTFSPTGPGQRTAILEVYTNSPGFSPLSVPLVGNRISVTQKPGTTNAAVIKIESGTANLLIEGLGPATGKPNPVFDPVLELWDATDPANETILEVNNDWDQSMSGSIPPNLRPGNPTESAIIRQLGPGSYTIVEEGNCGRSGSGEIRVFDLSYNALMQGEVDTTTGIDTDGDALPDDWETKGVTVTSLDACFPGNVTDKSDGEYIDLPKMGADPLRKDIFVHADWMGPSDDGRTFKPMPEAIEVVKQSFANAPSPAGPINLHVDLGSDSKLGFLKTWDNLSKAGQVDWHSPIAPFPSPTMPNPTLESVDKKLRFYPAKRQHVFHYALFGDKFDDGKGGADPFQKSGQSNLPGSDLFLAFGSSSFLSSAFPPRDRVQHEFAQAGVFMHELGHNLGLQHGGNDGLDNKPNYRSVMNDAYVITGRQTVNKYFFPGHKNYTIDYGAEVLAPINENAVSEDAGIGLNENNVISFQSAGQKHYVPGPSADWNWSGKGANQGNADEHNPYPFHLCDDNLGNSKFHTLFPAQDWHTDLVFGGGKIGIPKGTQQVRTKAAETSIDEPVVDELEASLPDWILQEWQNSPKDVFTVSTEEGHAPLKVDFDGTASTAIKGEISSWHWDFGDGTTGTGSTVTHTYLYSGTYQISLDVIDTFGNANVAHATESIDVRGVPSTPPKLGNISTRMAIGNGDNALIGGFIITGSRNKTLMIRGIGPSLSNVGINGALPDPFIELHNSAGATIATNDNWGDSEVKRAILDSTIAPTNSFESAIVATLPADAYTVVVRGVGNTTGIGLVEVYDLDTSVGSNLANISTRGFVDTGDNVMIGGTIVTGTSSTNVLIRAIGPSLTNFGVPNALQDPTLELHNTQGNIIASNDNWMDSPDAAAISATTLQPTDNRESAILKTLSPGAYTAVVRGTGNSTGVALVEAYQLK
jgi:hypothetical protein